MKKLFGQFAVRKVERRTFYNDCQVRLVVYAVLIRSNGLSKDSSDSIALDGLPQPFAGHDPYLAPPALYPTRVNGQVFVGRSEPGSVKSPEFVLFS